MKVICCYDNGEAVVVTDSALTRTGQPVFLPDFAAEWQGMVMPAVRVSRLGRFIGCKFASRYYDAIGAIHRLYPAGAERTANGLLTDFDGAIAPGLWIAPIPQQAVLDVNGQEISLEGFDSLIQQTISDISRHLTIKTGDIVALAQYGIATQPQPDKVIEASISGEKALLFKFK